MALKKGDFVEVEFTGKIKGTDEVFDTNIDSEAKKAGLDIKNLKPFILSIGQKMLPSGFDFDLEGKDVGNSHTIELEPENAFGKRNPQMVKMIPTKLFHEQKINPQRGMQLALDGQLVKILSSSGGRTLVDFNNPLAGKNIVYNYKINRKIEDDREKVNAVQDFFLRSKFDFDIVDKIVTFKIPKRIEPMIKLFSSKFEEILGLKIESKIVEKKEKSKEENKE